MKLTSLLSRFKRCPLIASVQASERSPVDHPDTLLRLARASIQEGVEVLRLEGIKNIRVIKPGVPVPIIGLLKRPYPKSEVYITPTGQDADALIEQGCEVIALDATLRERPRGEQFGRLVDRIHRRDTLVMADCDTLESALEAARAGADLIGTTLAGYTSGRNITHGPDLELLRQICKSVQVPVIAEGRYSARWEVETALRIGASAVVVGGALNDPVKQTVALKPSTLAADERIGAVDIGGTWLRFSTFGLDWQMLESIHEPNPPQRKDRIDWIREQISKFEITRLGLSTGGVVDPRTGEVVTAKEYLMPDHIGIKFDQETLGVPVHAHGDGHASAWAHANLPEFAGRRVATLALGTGVGCGFVSNGKIWAGRQGQYPRINDLPSSTGETYEKLMGGKFISKDPTDEQKQSAKSALEGAVAALNGLYFYDDLVVCGGVGMSDWLKPELDKISAIQSPFGGNAGLFGAAALALFPGYL